MGHSLYLTVQLRQRRTNKYKHASRPRRLHFHLPALQAAGSDAFTAIAILIVAIGLVGLAILILFSKRKI
jgi:hypothetical protein